MLEISRILTGIPIMPLCPLHSWLISCVWWPILRVHSYEHIPAITAKQISHIPLLQNWLKLSLCTICMCVSYVTQWGTLWTLQTVEAWHICTPFTYFELQPSSVGGLYVATVDTQLFVDRQSRTKFSRLWRSCIRLMDSRIIASQTSLNTWTDRKHWQRDHWVSEKMK
jgi:hypothetical protein